MIHIASILFQNSRSYSQLVTLGLALALDLLSRPTRGIHSPLKVAQLDVAQRSAKSDLVLIVVSTMRTHILINVLGDITKPFRPGSTHRF
jgi:hypothetical protein